MQSNLNWHAEYGGKTVCVIGGTSGIGKAIAAGFDAAGAKVIATGSSETTVAHARREASSPVEFQTLDVRAADSVAAFCKRFVAVHALVNTVGVSRAFSELEAPTMAEVVDTNLTGVARVCAEMHPALKAARGAVINFASMTSYIGSSSNPVYSAAKGGVVQLTKSLALLWGADGIRVNAIAPGYVRTGLTERRWRDDANSRAIVARTPLGRWGEPDDIVGPVLFLGSSAAAFVTGIVLPVDGGFLTA